MPRVSFVVIAYNEAQNIGRSLAGIAAQTGLPDYEVVVVDDGSRDGTADIVRRLAAADPRIRLVALPRNRGRGYARSKGIGAAAGELIATVDADILLPADWYTRAAAALGGPAAHHGAPHHGAPRHGAPHHGRDAVGGTAVPDGDVAYVYQATRLVPRVRAHTTAVTGSNALYRRRVFDLVGFDPALREGEDSALGHAVAAHGLAFATVPGLLVEHIERKPFAESLRWLFQVGAGATRQLLTYRQVRVPDVAAGAFAAGTVLGVGVAVAVSPFGLLIPAALLAAISVQHVHSRFETPPGRWLSVGGAVAVDGALLLAYFAGRCAGLTWLLRGPRRAAANGPVSQENASQQAEPALRPR